jgi:hypothetical protein
MTQKEKNAARMREWRMKNPERNNATGRACYWRNPEKRRAVRRRCPYKRTAQTREKYRQWAAEKRATDENFRLMSNLRSRLCLALKGKTKSAPTLRLIGCSIEYLWLYLESRFEEGMTRENYGTVWEVDHIIPCALFDFTKEDHQKRCFFFGNLQPLFATENRIKGARLVSQHNERIQALST